VELEDNYAASNTSPGAIPVQPATISHVHRFDIPPASAGGTVTVRVSTKGVGLWMPNSGTDHNYVNVRTYWKRYRYLRETSPALSAMSRVLTSRVWPPNGANDSRHMVTVPGVTFTKTVVVDAGEPVTVFVALSAEIDNDNDRPATRLPLLKHWHAAEIAWTHEGET
jgi:hypothetical protein